MTTPGVSGQTHLSNGEPPPPPPRTLRPNNAATRSTPSVSPASAVPTPSDDAVSSPPGQAETSAVQPPPAVPSTSSKSVRPFSKQSLSRPPDDPKAAGNARLVREYGFSTTKEAECSGWSRITEPI
ncbi:vegetative cell wall protein gp1-like [Ctenocephalides felis]|uniref:vegetative cell wall protein gp1-like n=1 Tax=Ctenocephalides felis TaxID=7515 RepID=UPI000E6E2096|nr:vegetative cell wall protein gp1-like [Ctenocephalides felis]